MVSFQLESRKISPTDSKHNINNYYSTHVSNVMLNTALYNQADSNKLSITNKQHMTIDTLHYNASSFTC